MRAALYLACVAAIALLAPTAGQAPLDLPSASDVSAFIKEDVTAITNPRDFFHKIIQAVRGVAEEALRCNQAEQGLDKLLAKVGLNIKSLLCEKVEEQRTALRGMAVQAETDPSPYFGFIPIIDGYAIPDGDVATWSAPCFSQMTAQAETIDGKVTLSFTAKKANKLVCADDYLLFTVNGVWLSHIATLGLGTSHTVTWEIPDSELDPAGHFDLTTKGIRIGRLVKPLASILVDLVKTALLFEPELTKTIPGFVESYNLDFLQTYTQRAVEPRTAGTVKIPEDQIHAGDAFGIIRLDGLDPMLAWAMGSTTGHTAMALRDPTSGTLYVAESTTKGAYWPTDGIQKHPYSEWVLLAEAADYSVVHMPLSEKYRNKFDNTAAWKFFTEQEGFSYGFYNILMGWIDSVQNNYPCLPPDFKACLTWDMFEFLFSMGDRFAPKIMDLILVQALNQRLGTTGLLMKEVLHEVGRRGTVKPNELVTIVESDDWVYNTTRFGEPAVGLSMVCNVFVCRSWKEGGIFEEVGNDVNCAEFTNWDMYSLNIFDDPENRPQVCKDADPDNINCQIVGKHKLKLNNYNSVRMHSGMGERCEGVNPTYIRGDACFTSRSPSISIVEA